MERVSTGERTAADQLMVSDRSPDRALTERILETADEAGYRAALIDATDGSVTAWPRFARTVRAAAGIRSRRPSASMLWFAFRFRHFCRRSRYDGHHRG